MNNKFLIAFSICFLSFTSISQQLERMVLENWVDGKWENRMQELPFYNEEGRLIRKEIAHWNSSTDQWEDQKKTEYNHDKNGVLLSREIFKWNSEFSIWKATQRASFSINDQNKPSNVLTEAQDENGWFNQSVDEYEYDANGNLIKRKLSRWDKVSLSWIPYRKFDYRIESDKTAGYTIYFWDNNLSDWRPYKNATYHYVSEDFLDHIVFESWIDGEWQNHSVRKNFRDEEGVLSVMEVDLFENESSSWEKSSHVDYDLTDFGKISNTVSKKWQSEASSWENLQRSMYYYSKDGVMLSEWEETSRDMELFPNPAKESLTIRSLPKGTLTIVDALGKIVLQAENSEDEMQLDVSKWEMGVYSVRVDGNEVQQFVKQ